MHVSSWTRCRPLICLASQVSSILQYKRLILAKSWPFWSPKQREKLREKNRRCITTIMEEKEKKMGEIKEFLRLFGI